MTRCALLTFGLLMFGMLATGCGKSDEKAAQTAPASAAPMSDDQAIQGTWDADRREKDGVPDTAPATKLSLVFEGDKLKYVNDGKIGMEATYKLDLSKTPHVLTMLAAQGAAPPGKQVVSSIYEISGSTLKIGNKSDDTAPDSFTDKGTVVLYFKRH